MEPSLFTESLRSALRPVLRRARAIPPRARLAVRSRSRPLALFLPAAPRRDGAARLRIYNIAQELSGHGWTGLVVHPALTLAQRHDLLAAARPDIVVMQGARHALNRPALYPGTPIVFDMDDADFHLPHLEGPVRAAMPDVAAVISGSSYVADWCRSAGAVRAEVVVTGAPVSALPRPAQAGRPPVVVWAQTRPMTYTAEADVVRDVMKRVAAARPNVRLRLYDRLEGDDPAFAESFRAAGITTEWVPRMSYMRYLASFDDAAVALAPLCPQTPFSRGKSAGKVLAYLDRKVPVIASAAGEHWRVLADGAGLVSSTADVWVEESLRLLGDGAARQDMADTAFDRFATQFALAQTAARVAAVLEAVHRDPARPPQSVAALTPVGA